jgi:hypothetical protein
MDSYGRHSQCTHAGYHSGLGLYSHEHGQIRYVLVCDDCGVEVREVFSEDYAPNPLLEVAPA